MVRAHFLPTGRQLVRYRPSQGKRVGDRIKQTLLPLAVAPGLVFPYLEGIAER